MQTLDELKGEFWNTYPRYNELPQGFDMSWEDAIEFVYRKVTNSTEVLEAEALRTPPTTEVVGIRAGDLL